MFWIIVIFFVWVGWKLLKFERNVGERHEEKKQEQYKQTINRWDVKKELFDERVRELNLNLDDAIYVLLCDDTGEPKVHKYLWYEDGALAVFSSINTYGTWQLTESPKSWTVYYAEKSNIEGIYRRSNYCQLNFNDGSNAKFSLKDYDAIKKLLTDNGLIQ